MNTAQLLRQSLFDIDAVRQDLTTDPFFIQAEMLTWANQGKDRVEKVLRQAKEDYNLLIMQSDDATFRWCGVTYDPSSFQLLTTTRRYTLPPDCLEIRRIRCITSGYEDVQFLHLDLSTPDFKRIEEDPEVNSGTIVWDILGENTLYIANYPPATIDIEIAYIPRTAPLQIYTTGTVSLTQGSASVTGGTTSWVINEVRSPLELIVSADGTAPKIVSATSTGTWVDPAETYYPVSTIDSDGGLTLAGTWLKANAATKGYILATVPSLPAEHHQTIADYISYRALKKSRNPEQDSFKKAFDDAIKEMKGDIQERQSHNPHLVTPVDWDN